jgi:hypothetical protein
VKRDVEQCIVNPQAIVPSNRDDLDILFRGNYSSITYPMFGLGNFFYFKTRSPQ